MAILMHSWLTGAGTAGLSLLLDATLKGTLILVLALLATRLLRHQAAATRHLVWLLAVVSLLLLPLLSATVPAWQILPAWMNADKALARSVVTPAPVSVAPSVESEPVAEISAEPVAAPPARAARLGTSPTPSRSAAAAAPNRPVPLSSTMLVVCVWAIGATAVLLRTLLGLLSLGLLGWRATIIGRGAWTDLVARISAEMGLRRRVTLLASRSRMMPMIWGICRPKLLLPAEAQDWPIARWRVVLLHELAHAKRWDCLWQMIVQVACAVYWFHPLVWAARHWMQVDREEACDDLVLEAGSKPSEYARHLLEVAAGLHAGRISAAAAIAMARSSRLEGRLLAILDVRRSRGALSYGVVLAGILLLGGVIVPVAMLKAAIPTEARPALSPGSITPSALPAASRPVAGALFRTVASQPSGAQTPVAGRTPEMVPASRLDFRVALQVDELPNAERHRYVSQLTRSGPQASPGDPYAWFELKARRSSLLIVGSWNARTYVLLHNQPPKVMLMDAGGTAAWGLDAVRPMPGQKGETIIHLLLDDAGGKLFADLTGRSVHSFLAILVNDQVVAAPVLQTPIGAQVQFRLDPNDLAAGEISRITTRLMDCVDRPGVTTSQPATTQPARAARRLADQETRENMPEGAGLIAGRVVDDKTGEPVRAYMMLFYEGTYGHLTQQTLEDGSFEFPDLPAGKYSLTMTRAAGYSQVNYNPQGRPGHVAFFPLGDGQQLADVLLRLKQACRISGRVLDEQGQPVTSPKPELRVIAWAESPDPKGAGCRYEMVEQSPIGDDGQYSLAALDGRPVYVMAHDFRASSKDDPWPPRYAPGTFSREDARRIRFDDAAVVENVDIRLSRGGGLVLEGTVTDEQSGQPIPHALVAADHADMLFDHVVGYTDDQGHYRLQGLDAGKVQINVDATPADYVRYRKPLALAKDNDVPARLDFALSKGVRIRGRFVDAAGSAVSVNTGTGYGEAFTGQQPDRTGYSGQINRYGADDTRPFGTFYKWGEGAYTAEIMQFPSATTFVVLGVPAGQVKITFDPKQPGHRTLRILHAGQDITQTGLHVSPGETIEDVTVVLTQAESR